MKKHWEKILLGFVLTLLAGGALFVVLEVPSIKAKLEEQVGYDQKNAFEPKDHSELKALLARAEAPKRLRLAGPEHNTFQSSRLVRGQRQFGQR